jgi:peroxiredoxin
MRLFQTFKILFLMFFMLSGSICSFGSVAGTISSSGEDAGGALLASGTAPISSLLNASTNEPTTFPVMGKFNIVFFWSLFCHSCLEELPKIQGILPKSDDYQVFCVSLDSDRMQRGLINFARTRRISYPILMEQIVEGRYLVADKWGVAATPTAFVVDPKGEIVFSHFGPMDVEAFATEFSKMLLENKQGE